MKKMTMFFLIASLWMTGCQPSATTTQTAALTENPCTDRGWLVITNYLYEFDSELNNANPKADMSIVIGHLEKTKNNIKVVGIDGCTEPARTLLISGLNNRIHGMEFIASGDNDSARIAMRDGFRLIISASDELLNYGIDLKYPKN